MAGISLGGFGPYSGDARSRGWPLRGVGRLGESISGIERRDYEGMPFSVDEDG